MMGICVIINVILNYVFTFGWNFIPSMGTSGLAIASLSVRTFLAVAVLIYCMGFFKRSRYDSIRHYAKDLIKIGAPIAGAMFIEFLGFNFVAVFVGKFDPIYAACHNIIISITSLTYMIPFSISSALTVKIGYANGSRNISEIKKYCLTSFIFILIYAFITVILYLVFKESVMRIFSNDTDVIKTGASIMVIVASFVTFDGIQGICTGALRGLKQTIQILLIMFLSYALISIPIGLVLAYKYNIILEGFWLGLAAGIFAAAIISGIILIKKYQSLKKEIISTGL